MSFSCSGQLKIKCDKCETINSIPCETLKFKTRETEDNQGGKDSIRRADFLLNCSNCNNAIAGQYDIWQHPENYKNHENIDLNGGTVIQRCEIELVAD